MRGRLRLCAADEQVIDLRDKKVKRLRLIRHEFIRSVAVALAVRVIAIPCAFAKGRVTVLIANRTPGVGQPFIVDVRTGFVVPRGEWLRLVAVAPGKDWL